MQIFILKENLFSDVWCLVMNEKKTREFQVFCAGICVSLFTASTLINEKDLSESISRCFSVALENLLVRLHHFLHFIAGTFLWCVLIIYLFFLYFSFILTDCFWSVH